MKLLRLLPALLLLAPLALTGCDGSDPDGFDDNPPPVIAPSAFAFDDSFEDGQTLRGAFGQNWLNAYGRVSIVSLAVGVHLVIPHVVTAAAVQADPYVEDGTWIWENTEIVHGRDVTFRLEATPDGEEIAWRMLISASSLEGADYDAFELYNATTTLDGRAGTWRLFYDIEGERTEVLDAEFEVTSAAQREITFIVPETNPNPDARGETIRYYANGDARLFDWHQEPEDYDHLVEWDEATKAGSITADDYNGGEPACWDEDLEDVPCE
jgi:hypothetical protein